MAHVKTPLFNTSSLSSTESKPAENELDNTVSNQDADRLIFADETESKAVRDQSVEITSTSQLAESTADAQQAWKVMLVDDEPSVHQATKIALKFFSFEGRPLDFVSAYSAQEAEALIKAHPDTALMLLDVIMETQDAGLQVAKYVREELNNHTVRIVLRTGQPGQVPEESVVVDYDINDYKTKLELTQQKLFTTLVSGLRAYRDLKALEESRAALQSFSENLERIVKSRTQSLANEVQVREKAEEALKVYIHALTHDLKNPVTGMTNVLQSLIQQKTEDEEPPSTKIPLTVLERMSAGCDRQLKMIDTLIETHGIEIGGVPLDPEPFSLADLVQSVVEEWQLRCQKKRVTMLTYIDPELPAQIKGDRAQLWRVFENLIGNALKYNKPETTITVSASCTVTTAEAEAAEADKAAAAQATGSLYIARPRVPYPNIVRCTVSDNGAGIPLAQQDSIFELYARGDDASPTQGLGLGLYICRRIVEAHGGRIGIHSQPGGGAQFWFDLPLGYLTGG